MKANKILFDIIFIIVSAFILIGLHHYGLIEKFLGFALIPILVAYFTGQYVGRKFNRK